MQIAWEMHEGYDWVKSYKRPTRSCKDLSFLKPRSHRISNHIQSTSLDRLGDYATEQGNPLIPPQCYLKMDEIEVVGVRDDVKPKVVGRRT